MPVAPAFDVDNRIVVPAQKREVRLDDFLLTSRLDNALSRTGYISVSDLDGGTFRELGKHRGLGRTGQMELHRALVRLGVVEPPRPRHAPTPLKIDVPPFVSSARVDVPPHALGFRVDDLPLSQRLRTLLARAGITVLGELHGKEPSESRGFGRDALRELKTVVGTLTTPSASVPRGLLDELDAALAALPGDRREALLLRFGGNGLTPLTLQEVGQHAFGVTKEAARQRLKHALAALRGLAGPDFGSRLRDLEQRVVAGEIDLGAELTRVGRVSPTGQRPSWDHPLFYERVLAQLAPGVAH